MAHSLPGFHTPISWVWHHTAVAGIPLMAPGRGRCSPGMFYVSLRPHLPFLPQHFHLIPEFLFSLLAQIFVPHILEATVSNS